MERGFSITDHPADLAIDATGADLREAFAEAARGLTAVVADAAHASVREERTLALAGADLQHLLVQWLSEILYWFDAQRFIGCSFLVDSLTPTALTARVGGEPFDPLRHPPRVDVKAVTYHQIAVRESPAGASVHVVLDI